MKGSVLYAVDGQVATITLNRPQVLNAIDIDAIAMISAAFRRAAEDEVRALILTGAGEAFCVGADIKQLQRWETEPALRDRFYAEAPVMFRLMQNFPAPIIAAVNGLCVAGGFELCCLADLVVASDSSKIGDGHANFVGFGPVSVVKAPLQLPGKKAAELLLTGELWTAAELARFGFVNRLAPPDALMAVARGLADEVASKQPLAQAAAKALIGRAGMEDPDILLGAAFEKAQAIFETEDFAEGLRAFGDKRPPVFRGR